MVVVVVFFMWGFVFCLVKFKGEGFEAVGGWSRRGNWAIRRFEEEGLAWVGGVVWS